MAIVAAATLPVSFAIALHEAIAIRLVVGVPVIGVIVYAGWLALIGISAS